MRQLLRIQVTILGSFILGAIVAAFAYSLFDERSSTEPEMPQAEIPVDLRVDWSSLSPETVRGFVEILHAQSVEQDKLLLVAKELARTHDRGSVLDAFRLAFEVQPVREGDCFLLEGLALCFDSNGRLTRLYRAVEGTTKPAEVLIIEESETLIGR